MICFRKMLVNVFIYISSSFLLFNNSYAINHDDNPITYLKMYHNYLWGYENFKQDEQKALEYLLKSVNAGYDLAKINLGMSYFEGTVTPKDHQKALQIFLSLQAQGYNHAHIITKIYLENQEIQRNCEKAFEWYKKTKTKENYIKEHYIDIEEFRFCSKDIQRKTYSMYRNSEKNKDKYDENKDKYDENDYLIYLGIESFHDKDYKLAENYLIDAAKRGSLLAQNILLFVNNTNEIAHKGQGTKNNTVSNKSINPAKRPLAHVSDSTVCYNATKTSNGTKAWNDRNENFVGEANYRGLDCGVKNDNKAVVTLKPKNTKPSISSAELEEERAKRLEEERKRKELEQRIAELERKNKELSKPKKQEPSKPKSGSGSGFFISKLGHIITNQHVVNKCSKITIGDRIDKQVPAQLLETDKRNDLALLRTTTLKMASAETKTLIQKLSIHIVPLATGGLMRGNDIELGEDVLVAGFPYGDIFSKNIKVTKGIVSSTTGVGDDSGQFQLDAAVQPGNSGGPIYDKYGNIVGVVVAQLNKFKMAKAIGSLPENVNFGIKASTVKQFLNTSGLPTKWSERKEAMSNQELSKIAAKQTVMVVCHRD